MTTWGEFFGFCLFLFASIVWGWVFLVEDDPAARAIVALNFLVSIGVVGWLGYHGYKNWRRLLTDAHRRYNDKHSR
jgi:amino acid permease